MVRRKQQRKPRVFLLLVVALITVGTWMILDNRQPDKPAPSGTSKPIAKPKTEQPGKIRLIATGDMLPHDTVNQAARTGSGYDYLPLFSQVSSYLRDTDLSFCNQESPSASQFSVSGYPTFNAPESFAQDLSSLGCNIINLANNHADDRGQSGIDATRTVWDNLPALAVAGTARSATEQDRVAYFTEKGVRFAFLSYAQCSNNRSVSSYGLNIFSTSLAGKQIAEAKTKSDMIIAAMHSCHEERSTEDNWQDSTAQYFADHGVDIVIGTGPHWLQPVKKLPKAGGGTTLVWFSLGNFLSSQLEVNGLIGGIAVMEIDIKTLSVSQVGFLPTYMHYEWTPSQKAAEDLLARHNLKIYPLDQAAAALARSQNHTTVGEQTTRVTKLLNMYTPVTMLTSQTYSTFGK